MKSFNWSKIPLSKVIGRDNLWSRVAKDHTGSQNDLDFDVMEGLFCQQSTSNGQISPKSGDSVDGSDKKKKDAQEINLLDGKRSLNINIFLKQFRSSHEDIVRILQEGTHQDLGAERLRGLLKILPESDEAEMLRNFDGEKNRLGNAEKFLLKLLDVPSYKLRIESMLLKEEFMANQEFLENSIETIRCAVQELEECKKLHEILYMVLVAGNFLNAGGYAGNAAGFKMMSLLKLTDIRANKPSVTLIHYVAEQATKKRSDLLEFLEEVQNLEEASKISMETLKTDVSSLSQRVSKVSSQVAVAESQIKSQMQDFLLFAENKVETLQNDINNLESLRQRLADFLCEDTDAFKLEDCFKVFHNFCTRFKAALQENERRRKQEIIAEARRKQREEQIALKRRSLELPDNRSGNDADHIMDQLLGDIRSGFPERRLGEIYRRSKSRPDQDDIAMFNSRFEDSKQKAQAAMKRHSDPTMFSKVDSINKSDEKLNTKGRRARFLDESNGDEIIGFLQNPVENELKDGRSFGSTDDFCFERMSSRRSGRRKRGDILNGEVQTRERIGSSPPPVVLPATGDSELSAKQKLKTKINDWMLQNEKEQKRDRELQLRMLKRQQVNGITSAGDNDDDMLRKTPDALHENVSEKNPEASRITRSSLSRQNDNFTQKIINLLNSTSNTPKAFERSKLYHSTREIGSKKHEMVNKSKDDTEINNSNEKENTLLESNETSSQLNSDAESNKERFKNLHHIGNFDRFASTRKTQRRLKLKEMRIEAENAIKGSSSTNSDVKDSTVTTTSTMERNHVTEEPIFRSSDNPTNTMYDSPDSQSEETAKSETRRESSASSTSGTPTLDTNSFNRNRSTSLRSRQSRLARRIDSLSTPVTSPIEDGKHILSDRTIDEVPEIVKNESGQTSSNPSKSNQETTAGKGSIESENCDIPKARDNTSKGPNNISNAKEPEKKATKINGHISHEVTISTESRKISVKSTPSQNSKTTSNNTNKKSIVTPSIIKTTQNVKVQQTIQRPKNKSSVITNGKVNKTSKVSSNTPSPMNSPSVSKKTGLGNKDLKSKPILNGKLENHKKDSLSQSSSVSSICSMSTNVKLVKDQQGQRNLNRTINGEKITINHNGSIRFVKDKRDLNKATPKVTTNTCVTSKGSIEKRDKNVSARKKL